MDGGDELNAASAAGRGGPETRNRTQSWQFAETFVPEDEVLDRARARAARLGIGAIGAGAGSLLRVLCASSDARAVVEVGTGAGVSGLWMLGGMPAEGVLTTIDADSEHLRAARTAFAEVGARGGRVRGITGRAVDVLPRLAEGGYDLVLLDADPTGLGEYLERAIRLLRPRGVLAIASALAQDRLADPAQRDPATTAVREVLKDVRAHAELVPSLVPSSGGLLLAVRRPGAPGGRDRRHA